MEATHIISPNGFKPRLESNDEAGVYWIDALKFSKGKWVFLSGAVYHSEDDAVSEWNAMFSSAPKEIV